MNGDSGASGAHAARNLTAGLFLVALLAISGCGSRPAHSAQPASSPAANSAGAGGADPSGADPSGADPSSADPSSADPSSADPSSGTTAAPTTGSGPASGPAAESAPGSTGATTGPAKQAPAVQPPTALPTTALPIAAVPAPHGGNVNQVVPGRPLRISPPVPLDGRGDFGEGVTVALTKVERVNAAARLPGEIAGPGIKVAVTITNGSKQTVDLSTVAANLTDGAGVPAILLDSQSQPVTGSLAAGALATGTYVFSFPQDRVDPATITILYSTEAPVALFVGSVR